MRDKYERLEVLLYQYFFGKDVLYQNKIVDVLNRVNYVPSRLDVTTLHKLCDLRLQYDTFSVIMSDVLSILSDMNREDKL